MTAQPVPVEIREAASNEYAAVGQVAVAAHAELVPPGDRGWTEYLVTLADVADRVTRTVVLVAVRGEKLGGTVTIELEATIGDELVDLPPQTASMRMLAVEPTARGRGIGRALVEAAIERCRAAGKVWLILETGPEQWIAAKLYRSIGFERDPGRDIDDHTAYRFHLT
jgi:ribosomal protein S18 acetylase RimI-like enzyme